MKSAQKVIFIFFVLMVFSSSIVMAKPIVLKFANLEPTPGLFNQKVFIPTFNKINEEAKDILRIDIYAGGTLGGDPFKQIKMIKDGIADIAVVINPYHPRRFADEMMLGIPFVTDDCTTCTQVINEMREQKKLRGYDDLVILGQICLEIHGLHTTFPVKHPGDLKGMKIRTGDKTQNPLIKALGGAPVGMGADKTAEGLSRGLVKGTVAEWLTMRVFGFAELVNHHTLVPLGTNPLSVAMTKKKYDSLPDAAKKVLDKYRGEYLTKLWIETLSSATQAMREEFEKDPKHTVYEPNADQMKEWHALIDPVVEDWKANNKSATGVLETFIQMSEKVKTNK